MATPLRLSELRCPRCEQPAWVMDNDYRGMDGVMVPYSERDYPCTVCGHRGPGWRLLQQAPPEFLLQPHSLYPMTQSDFDHWIEILKQHFPDHRPPPRPCLPEEAIRELEKYDREGPSAGQFRRTINDLKARFGFGED